MPGKRANGEGSIYYNEKRKRYEGQFSYYDSSTDKIMRKKFTGATKKIVAQKGNDFIETVKSGIDFKASQKTLSYWLEIWLRDFVKDHVKTKTYERYAGAVNCHINPYIGDVVIDNLKTETIQRVFNKLLADGGKNSTGLSPRTINNARRVLITALDKAVELGYIAKNIAKGTKPIKTEKVKMQILTKEQGRKLISCAKEDGRVQAAAIILALSTGMRLGEIFGLRWSCVDLANGTLTIDQTLVSTNNGIKVQSTAKTASSHRTIPLPSYAIEELINYRAWQAELKNKLLNQYTDKGLVIINSFGGYRDPNQFSYVVFKRILTEAEIDKKFRFHDLRHTHATWLLEQGVNIKVVSERLGHSSIRITLDIYGHVLKGMQEHAVQTIDSLLDDGSNTEK